MVTNGEEDVQCKEGPANLFAYNIARWTNCQIKLTLETSTAKDNVTDSTHLVWITPDCKRQCNSCFCQGQQQMKSTATQVPTKQSHNVGFSSTPTLLSPLIQTSCNRNQWSVGGGQSLLDHWGQLHQQQCPLSHRTHPTMVPSPTTRLSERQETNLNWYKPIKLSLLCACM